MISSIPDKLHSKSTASKDNYECTIVYRKLITVSQHLLCLSYTGYPTAAGLQLADLKLVTIATGRQLTDLKLVTAATGLQ